MALAYLVERAHPSYAGQLPLGARRRGSSAARGRSGNNIDYLISTLRIWRSSASASASWSGC